MAKPTRAELEAQLAALDDEENVALLVEDDKGRKTHLTGAHAKKWLKNLGLDDDDEPADEGEQDEPPAADPAPRSGYFGRKG